MEACSSAHYWARKLETLGHTVRLMAPQFVKPYVKSNKNDAADAECWGGQFSISAYTVSTWAVWKYRLFQQNRPEEAVQVTHPRPYETEQLQFVVNHIEL